MKTILCWTAIVVFCGMLLAVGIVGTLVLVALDLLRILRREIGGEK